MVGQVTWLHHLNTGHPNCHYCHMNPVFGCPVFRWLLYCILAPTINNLIFISDLWRTRHFVWSFLQNSLLWKVANNWGQIQPLHDRTLCWTGILGMKQVLRPTISLSTHQIQDSLNLLLNLKYWSPVWNLITFTGRFWAHPNSSFVHIYLDRKYSKIEFSPV